MQIKTLVITVVAVVAFLLATVGSLGIYSANEAVRLMQTVTVQDVREELDITKMRSLMETNRSQVLQALQHNPATEYAKMHDHPVANHFKVIDDTTAELGQLWSKYETSNGSAEEKQLAADWYAKSGKLGIDHIAPAAAGIKAEKWDVAQGVLIKGINPTYRQGDVALKALTEFFGKRTGSNAGMVGNAVSRNSNLMLAMLAFGLLFTIGIGVLLVRTLNRQLGGEPAYAKQIVSAIAGGDLSADIRIAATDRDSLLFSMKTMQGSLSNMVSQIRQGTESIATASGEIASGNLDLSSRTEQQAGSLEETASSMEELTSTVKQNADNARQANGLAMTASEVAKKGGAVVAEVVGTMTAINDSSRKIVDIIAVIDGIAFQTNILALNAAVEAARAGEQGRGFAVVASEVRSLAQRSAAAAKEIKTLIGDSVEKVEIGARLVDQAGATMNEIVESVKRVTDIMGEISAASQEQTSGIGQINQAIAQMDEATQQNAALVEEAAAAAESLQDQAGNLSQVVRIFKIGNEQTVPGLAGQAPSRPRQKPVLAQHAKKALPARAAAPGRAVSLPTKAGLQQAATTGGSWEEF